jgi:hypothetical protein
MAYANDREETRFHCLDDLVKGCSPVDHGHGCQVCLGDCQCGYLEVLGLYSQEV